MTEESNNKNNEKLQTYLQRVIELLSKYKLLEGFVNLQDELDETLTDSSVQKKIWMSYSNCWTSCIRQISPIFWKPCHWKTD